MHLLVNSWSLYNVVSKSLTALRCSMHHERNLAGLLPTSQPDIPASTRANQFPGLATEQPSTEDAAHYNNIKLVASPTEVSRWYHFVFLQSLRVLLFNRTWTLDSLAGCMGTVQDTRNFFTKQPLAILPHTVNLHLTQYYFRIFIFNTKHKKNLNQSHYRPGVAQRVPGS